MTALGYDQDPTELILSQIKLQKKNSEKNLEKIPYAYFQVEYLQKQILKMNPQEAAKYERTTDQENIKEYFEQISKDQEKYQTFKYDLKKKYFHIRHLKPPQSSEKTAQKEPIEMIKSFSQHEAFLRKSSHLFDLKNSHLQKSIVTSTSKMKQKNQFKDELQLLLDDSQKLAEKSNRYKLRGATMIEKQKINEEILSKERNEIIEIIKGRNYNANRPKKLDEISNKEKYSLDYLQYLKKKTKLSLDKNLYQKKIRNIEGKLEYFQQFILREGKLKQDAANRLQNFYINMRKQFRKIERNSLSKSHILHNLTHQT